MGAAEIEEPGKVPPRDNLVRATFPAEIHMRDIAGDTNDAMPTMHVGFARYREWTRIDSSYEGTFMEQIAPGAFTKTIKENQANMRVLFNHGRDPQIGNKVLGPIAEINDTAEGPVAEVPLLDTSYNRDLIPGLRAGVYGSSFRFKVMKEEFERAPKKSAYNPDGIPERTILEAQVMEAGPVTFPAYAGATAGMRSLTDDFLFGTSLETGRMDSEDLGTLAHMIKLGTDYIDDQDEPDEAPNIPAMQSALKILAGLVPVEVDENEPPEAEDEEVSQVIGADVQTRATTTLTSLTTAEAEPPHSEEPSRDTPTDDGSPPASNQNGKDDMGIVEDMRARQTQIRSELEEISSEHAGAVLTGDVRTRWDDLTAEWQDLDQRCQAEQERREMLLAMENDERHIEGGAQGQSTAIARFTNTATGTGTFVTKRAGPLSTPDDVFDITSYHTRARSQQEMWTMFGDGARRAIESFHYPHPRADKDTINTHIERVLADDGQDKEIAQRILVCGSPTYRAAFWKSVTKQNLSNEERTALAVGAVATGGAAVPPQIDPTLIPLASYSINPLRRISRVFTTTSNIWKGVTSSGITAQYRAEGAAMTDNSPTLAQPQLQPERADAFVPFSWELGQDWVTLEQNLASELQDSKDQVEAVKFALGVGHSSNEPEGILGRIIGGGGGTLVTTSLGTSFAVADVYAMEAALPPRFIANASWVASPAMFQRVRQFDTAGGANLWVQLQAQNPPELIGYPAYKATNVGTAGNSLAATAIWGVFGDFSRFAIVDRVGMSIRMIDNLFISGSTSSISVPTGQSGVVAFWRNTSGILDSTAFRVGTISTSH